jgi:hypothetical protein
MITLAADYKLGKNTIINSEFALSNNNINTFSKSDRKNDAGIALHLLANHRINLGRNDTTGWKINLRAFYDHTGKNFTPVEPFRPVEFRRDWNIITDDRLMEDFFGLSFELGKDQTGFVKYSFQSLLREDIYKGFKNFLSSKLQNKRWLLEFDGSFLNTDNPSYKTEFSRHKANVAFKFKKLMLGVKDDQEHNTFNDKKSDSLLANSYSSLLMELI